MIFWIILILLFLVKFKGLAINDATKAIPKVRKKIDGIMLPRLNILIKTKPIIAVGYPTKQPMHNPYFPILIVCPSKLSHSGWWLKIRGKKLLKYNKRLWIFLLLLKEAL